MKKKGLVRATGGAVSAGSGLTYSALVPFPFGLSSTYFYGLGPLSGYLGFEFGRWLGAIGYKPATICVLAVIVVPCALYFYDLMLHVGSPGPLNNLALFILFAAAIFAFGTALGVIELKIEDMGS